STACASTRPGPSNLRASGAPFPQEKSGDQQGERNKYDRPVTKAHIRCCAFAQLHVPAQYRRLELRNAGAHATFMIDNGGDARIRAPNKPAAGFDRAHTRELAMLQRTEGTAEPAIATHVDEQAGLRQRGDDFLAEHGLVADHDGRREAFTELQRATILPGFEIAVWQVHQAQPAPHEVRYRKVFAEWHEMALVIEATFFRTEH